MTEPARLRQTWLIVAALAAFTAILYWPMVHHPFISIDDHEYIQDTPQVSSGLTLAGVRWAFTTGHASNWHPLTWISHMFDCTLFGLNPGGHHFMNLLFHAANAALLFLMLRQLTGATFRPAFVAALFAWHPLHVESVAWASERKDVLCALFWFLATMAYVRFVRERQARHYRLTLILFGLGLMSKPMLVTFPFVLLLLDFWPLRRCRLKWLSPTAGPGDVSPETLVALVREKIPLFALAMTSSVVTYFVQSRGGAVSSLQAISPLLRLENAVISYARYVSKTFWPTELAAIYPYPRSWPLVTVLSAVSLVALISVGALWAARRRGYWLVGWFWFLGTLVPTIGLVQVGSQSMADRYTYIPSIGLFIAVAWGLHELVAKRPRVLVGALATLGVATVAACGVAARKQLATWRSSEALFRHALAVTKDNYIALDGLGSALDHDGRAEEAFKLIEESVRLEPRYPEAQYDLGTLLMRRGDYERAIVHFRNALRDNSKFAAAHSNLGTTFLRQGNLVEAEKCFRQALALQPSNAEAYYNLATLRIQQGQAAEAITNLLTALQLKPAYAQAHANLGVALMRQGNVEQGTRHFREAARLEPKNSDNHFNLGLACLDQGNAAEAETSFAQAISLNATEPKYFHRFGLALVRQKKFAAATAAYRAALKLQPDHWELRADLAWLLATAAEAGARDGAEAVKLAEQACELSGRTKPTALLALAAAQAETGRFAEGMEAAKLALRLATETNQQVIADQATQVMARIERQQPLRE